MSNYPEADPAAFLDLATSRLDRQLSFADSLDGKLTGTIGWATGSLAVQAAVIALRPHAASHAAPIAVAVLGFVTYVVLSGAVLIATRQKDWHTAPDVNAVYSAYAAGTPEAKIRWDLASKYVEMYSENEKPYQTKTVCLSIATWSLVVITVSVLTDLILIALH